MAFSPRIYDGPAVRALVTGATGVLGPPLVDRLHKDGYHVRVLARRAVPPGLFSVPVDVELGDISDAAAVRRAAKGVDIVFHLAALLHVSRPSPALRAEYHRTNVAGTEIVAHAAAESGAARLVYLSSIAVYGPTRGALVDERTVTRPDTMYAETKRRGEEIVLGVRRSDGAPLACVLRMAAVYGPRMKGNYRRLADALASGLFVPIGDGKNRRTLVHEKDAASAASAAARHSKAAGAVFNVVGGVYPLYEILGAMSEALGRAAPRWHVPAALLRAAVGLADAVTAAVGRPMRAGALLDKYLEDIAVSGARIDMELGWKPSVSLGSGWHDALAGKRAKK